MSAPNVSAPVKDQPHPFQPTPEASATIPGAAGPTGEKTDDGTTIEPPRAENCALCNAPRGDKIHIDGEADANGDSIKWG